MTLRHLQQGRDRSRACNYNPSHLSSCRFRYAASAAHLRLGLAQRDRDKDQKGKRRTRRQDEPCLIFGECGVIGGIVGFDFSNLV